ncbi:hypothetical protein OAX11_05160 [Flavobacteriaceae bacterium]|nr:hypothetical protein [Flavobacteriaceae bacterium]
MKNLILIATLLVTSFIAVGQEIVPLETKYSTNFLARDVYFKDVNGVLNKFIGTWKYQNINTIFEITFYKRENISSIHNCTSDDLLAKFKLIINGVEQYNTYENDYGKLIVGGDFTNYYEYDSVGNVTKIPVSINRYEMSIVEPNFLNSIDASDLYIEYENSFGIEKLNWNNEIGESIDYVTGQQVNIYKMPLNMVLIKQ